MFNASFGGFSAGMCLTALAALSLPQPPARGDAWVSLENAKALEVQALGEPVRSMRQGGTFMVPKPEGKGWWCVTCYNPLRRNSLPCQIYVIDLDTKQVSMTLSMPAGGIVTSISTRGLVGKDGRYYMPFLGTPLALWRFDPRDASLKFLPTDVELMMSAYSMGIAPDGKIYLGSCSKAAMLVELDPATEQYRNLGVQGPPHEAPRYVWTLAVADDYVYSTAGKNPWYLVATDRRAGTQKVLMTEGIDYMEVSGSGEQCVAFAKVKVGDQPAVTKHYRLRGGNATEYDPLKEPRPARPVAAPEPEVLPAGALPNSEGKAEFWFRLPGKEWDSVALTGIQTQPFKINALGAMPDGRIMGAARDYQDCFLFSPKTGQFSILGKPPLAFGTMEWVGGRMYLLGYPGSYVMEYDPARPWTAGTTTSTRKEPPLASPESNPRECHRWSVDIMPTHFIRASALGADGLIYFGAHAERQAVGGGLGWWDPVNRKAGGLRAPFVVQDCAGMAAAQEGRTIVYSSVPVADPAGKTPKPDGARLYLLDTATKQITGEITPLPGLASCGPIVALGDRVYGVAEAAQGSLFYVVDLVQKKTVFSEAVPSGFSPRIGPDGNLYLFVDKALLRVAPGTLRAEVLGTVDPPGGIAFLDGDIYLSGAPALRRIRGAVAGR